ncbi:Bro-N domain-containing protein [Marinibaculum pumilum]|uniref:Bro-N domain-containing protein n=1 Tax=Marinibaculum pumilum TaxID=1766165 RepID=A0ABV7L481_9PROT
MERPFHFEGMPVRIWDASGEPWFVLVDVCRVLEIGNTTMAARALDPDEKNTLNITDGNRGNPNRTIINESGLYSLILTSRKPAAKRFKKWVTAEVLPSIRKTGSYGAPALDMRDPAQMQQAFLGGSGRGSEKPRRLTA